MTTFINQTVAREQIAAMIAFADNERTRRELRRARRDARRAARDVRRRASDSRPSATVNVPNWPHLVGYAGCR